MRDHYIVPELTSEERHDIYRQAQALNLKTPNKPFANYLDATILHVLDKQIIADVKEAFHNADCRDTKFNPENLEPGDFFAVIEEILDDGEEDGDEEYHWYLYLGGDMFYDGHGCIDLKTLLEMAEAFGYQVRQLEYVS